MTRGRRPGDGRLTRRSYAPPMDDLRALPEEMAQAGEAVRLDGLATQVQRPCGWASQKVLYDFKRHS